MTGAVVDHKWAAYFDNLKETNRALQIYGVRASKELTPRLRVIVRSRLPEALVRTKVPKGETGNLRKGVKWSVTATEVSLVSRARHSHLVYQGIQGRRGVEGRHFSTSKGPNRYLHRAVVPHIGAIQEDLIEALQEWGELALQASRV